jgi:hypothetical protein
VIAVIFKEVLENRGLFVTDLLFWVEPEIQPERNEDLMKDTQSWLLMASVELALL